MAIPGLLRSLAVDPELVMADAGITLAVFDDPDNVVPYATLGRLFASCAQRTGMAEIGLRIGAEATMESLGLLGAYMQNCANVRSALEGLVTFRQLADRGGQPTFRVEDTSAVLGYAITQSGVAAADLIADAALVLGCNLMRALCGPNFAPISVMLRRPQPSDTSAYRRAFGRALRFDAPENGIVFSPRWLDHPLPTANESVRRLLEQQIREEDSGARGGVEHMRRVLRMLVHAGEATEERLAHVFAMHRRTINRRLRAEGTTFRELVDDVRFEVARHLLETTDLSVVHIAGTLSYADASAFTRAFRRWSQTTPAQWRQAHAGAHATAHD